VRGGGGPAPPRAAPAAPAPEADAYILGTPANLGYISGALKHFFDQVYYPCMGETARRPYGLYVHGNNDTTGAVAAVETITTGLEWQRARDPVTVVGEVRQEDLDACWELGASVAAGLTMDLA
jgi:multimeric flavodoxin WrbA